MVSNAARFSAHISSVRQAGLRSFSPLRTALVAALVLSSLALAGCGSGSGGGGSTGPAPDYGPVLDLELTDSITGGLSATTTASILPVSISGGGTCAYDGASEADILLNGFTMSRFMGGTLSTWVCIADVLMRQVSEVVYTNAGATGGALFPITPDAADAQSVTGLSITADSATQTTVKLFFRGATVNPGFYLSWNTLGTDTEGRLIVDFTQIAQSTDTGFVATDPTDLRLDFFNDATSKAAQLYVAFDTAHAASGWINPNLDGFAVEVTKNIDTDEVTLNSHLDLHTQFETGYGGAALPTLKTYAVVTSSGSGASTASFYDVALELPYAGTGGGTLGVYLFSRRDVTYFTSAGTTEWVDKTVIAASYDGAGSKPKTTTPAQDIDIASALTQTAAILTTANIDACIIATPGTDCDLLLQGVFDVGVKFGTEQNGPGAEPLVQDPRRAARKVGTQLIDPFPVGETAWTNVFDMVFTPTLVP